MKVGKFLKRIHSRCSENTLPVSALLLPVGRGRTEHSWGKAGLSNLGSTGNQRLYQQSSSPSLFVMCIPVLLQGQRPPHKALLLVQRAQKSPSPGLAPASAPSVRAASSLFTLGPVQAPIHPAQPPQLDFSQESTDNSSLALIFLEGEVMTDSWQAASPSHKASWFTWTNSEQQFQRVLPINNFVLHSSIRYFFISTKHTGLTDQCSRS